MDPKGTTARKLKEIGEKLTRFQPYLEKLPNTWTTIYVLAKMDDHEFQRVADFWRLASVRDAESHRGRRPGRRKPERKSTPSTSSSI